MEFSAVIVAAGSGTRAGEGLAKQWRLLGGKAVLAWSVDAFMAAGARQVVVVLRPGDESMARDLLPPVIFATGGKTRAASVQSGLSVLSAVEVVFIHDAARPFVTAAHIQSLLTALQSADGAVPALPVSDTLKRDIDTGLVTTPRDNLWRAQTPQAFRLETLKAAYAAFEGEPTDDAQVVEASGGRVVRTPGDPRLMKLTHPEDFAIAEALTAKITRTGQGFDAHRFGPGDSVWLCGVKINHDAGLVGHSDADVGLHALTDALLGAIGEGDIGDHFPPSDPQWKGASSDVFLRHAADLIARRGGRILNVDVTLICEAPKIKPHRDAMCERIAGILGLPVGRVAVKATTTEGMGFTGRREGLAAQAIATVETPA